MVPMHQRCTNQGLRSFFLVHCGRWEARSNRRPVTPPACLRVIAASIAHSHQEGLNRRAVFAWRQRDHRSFMAHRYEGLLVMPFPIRRHDRVSVGDRPWPDRLLRCRLLRRQSCLYQRRAASGLGCWRWRISDLLVPIAVAEGPRRGSG